MSGHAHRHTHWHSRTVLRLTTEGRGTTVGLSVSVNSDIVTMTRCLLSITTVSVSCQSACCRQTDTQVDFN